MNEAKELAAKLRELREPGTPGTAVVLKARTTLHICIDGHPVANVSMHGGLPVSERAEYLARVSADAELFAFGHRNAIALATALDHLAAENALLRQLLRDHTDWQPGSSSSQG